MFLYTFLPRETLYCQDPREEGSGIPGVAPLWKWEVGGCPLPNLEMNGSRFVFSKWLVQLFLYGKENSKTTKKGRSTYCIARGTVFKIL